MRTPTAFTLIVIRTVPRCTLTVPTCPLTPRHTCPHTVTYRRWDTDGGFDQNFSRSKPNLIKIKIALVILIFMNIIFKIPVYYACYAQLLLNYSITLLFLQCSLLIQ